MFYAMNRFNVPLSQNAAFEARWLNRESKLHDFEGFVEFNLLKGPESDGERLYISHTIWVSEAHFQLWLKSLSFKEAHARSKPSADAEAQPKMISRNSFEMLESVQRLLPKVTA